MTRSRRGEEPSKSKIDDPNGWPSVCMTMPGAPGYVVWKTLIVNTMSSPSSARSSSIVGGWAISSATGRLIRCGGEIVVRRSSLYERPSVGASATEALSRAIVAGSMVRGRTT